MKIIVLLLMSAFIISCVQLPKHELSPLDAMVGKWSIGAGKCNEKWVTYSLSRDRKRQLSNYFDGRTSSAVILEVRQEMFHLQYEGEQRKSPDGELVSWWFIFEGRDIYQMRRNDWPEKVRTRGSWLRCGR